ncbi:hypothetical protein ABT063_24780 [Streptomyces sp. NPDC002838]|uniref:hypothetical protein n=1 Tax=Streptomyces sp. NPDC002838 TaxID=3154436 RepID=UPI00331DA40A
MAYEFRNEKYPQLQIASAAGKVRFDSGEFATDDEALAEALRALPEGWGVTETTRADEPGPQDPPGGGEGSGSGPEEIKPPARSASKAEWAEYARSLAADSDEVNQINVLTKEQLIEQYGAEG